MLLFQVSQPDPAPPSASSSRWTAATVINRALNGATNQWLKLGEKPKDGWMYWFYARGEGLMDKIEFEEWMLKGIHEGRGVEVLAPDRISRGETQQKIQVCPSSISLCSSVQYGASGLGPDQGDARS